jgi:hypothetical protein
MKFSLSRSSIAVLSFLLCSGTGMLCAFFLLGAAIAQEKGTSDVSTSTVSMDSTRASVLSKISSSQRVFVNDFSSLRAGLESQGWTWIDQAGPLARYRRGSQALNVNCGMSSSDYMMCDLNQTP